MTVDNKNITIRPYQSGDENQICSLFIKIFKIKQKKDEIIKAWYWKYKNNPNGFKTLVGINQRGDVIGHCGLITREMIYYGKEIEVSIGADYCLDKSYAGQKFIRRCFDYYDKKLQFTVLGFSNKLASSIYAKKSFNENFPILVFKVNIFKKRLWFINNFKIKSYKTDVTIGEINNPEKEINDFWLNKKNELKISSIRNWSFINWRVFNYFENNQLFFIKKVGKIVGYVVIEILNKKCIIKDILIYNNDTNNEAIIAIEKWCQKMKLQSITIMINNSLISNVLLDGGYKIKEQRYLSYSNKNHPIKNTLDLYLTFADSDYYNF